MRTIWQQAGLQSVEPAVIRIPVYFASFDDFWEIEPRAGRTNRPSDGKLSPAEMEQIKAHCAKILPIAADGRIAYEAFANAVKGRVP